MEKRTYSGSPEEEIPLGFGVALAQNEQALERFWQLGERQKQRFLFEARHARNRDEMARLVTRIGEYQ